MKALLWKPILLLGTSAKTCDKGSQKNWIQTENSGCRVHNNLTTLKIVTPPLLKERDKIHGNNI